jgi:hypothetical protein
MAQRTLVIAFCMIAALPMRAAANNEPTPTTAAPTGTPNTRYCLRVDAITGSRLETIQCRTRDDWALLEVDVDQEWAENGVRVINS